MHAQLLIRIEGTSQKSSLAVSNRPGAIAPNPERPRGAGRGGDNAAPAAPRSLFPPVSRREALREGWAGPGRAAPLAGGRRISLGYGDALKLTLQGSVHIE